MKEIILKVTLSDEAVAALLETDAAQEMGLTIEQDVAIDARIGIQDILSHVCGWDSKEARKAEHVMVSNVDERELALEGRGQTLFGDKDLREINGNMVVHKDDARYAEFLANSKLNKR